MKQKDHYSLACALSAIFLTAAALAATHSASGTIRHNTKTVQLQAAVAVWEPAESELRIALLPFVPSSQEIAEIRNAGAVFVAAERPSPNPALWDRPPFAVLVIKFRPGTSTATMQDITHYRLEVAWLDRMNHTSTLNRNYEDEVRREFSGLSGSLREGGQVRVALRGGDTVFDDTLAWNFQAEATVYVKR